jgi:hypothetical protein
VDAGGHPLFVSISFMRLNDDRQGEGGTLAVINVNITTTLKIWQDLFG